MVFCIGIHESNVGGWGVTFSHWHLSRTEVGWDDDANANGNDANLPTSRPLPQEGTVTHAIHDFLLWICEMSKDGAYQLVVTQGYNSFDTFRYLSDKTKVTTISANIRHKCNQYQAQVQPISRGCSDSIV